jgi:hypothetical protein
MTRIRDLDDNDLIHGPRVWRDHVQARHAGSFFFFRPSDNELQLAENCVDYAYEILRLRKIIRKIREEASQ